VKYADVGAGSTCAVIGLGPIGQMCARIAKYLGAEQVIAVDSVPERLELARRHDIAVLDERTVDDVPAAILEMTGGRGVDGVVDALGMEAHGTPLQAFALAAAGELPGPLGRKAAETMGVDRMGDLADRGVRRAGRSVPDDELVRQGRDHPDGQAHVKRWVDDIMPALTGDDDPLGTEDLTTHVLPLEQAPYGYKIFQKKQDGCIKVVLKP